MRRFPTEGINIQCITVDLHAILPTETETVVELPATVIRKELAYDEKALLTLLLGENYEHKQRGEYDYTDDYVSRAADKQERCVLIDIKTGSFSHHDGMVADEREDGYVPPLMKMTQEESLALCRALLGDVFPNEWLKHIGIERTLLDRWNSEEESWMTEGEYSAFLRSDVVHYHLFEHRIDNGVKILDDELLAAVCANGLSMFEINWLFEVPNANYIIPMSLEEAISMANSTRLGPAVLLGAELVYSNRLTTNDQYNLSWFLITSNGNYVVDCVLNKHKCDSYEY